MTIIWVMFQKHRGRDWNAIYSAADFLDTNDASLSISVISRNRVCCPPYIDVRAMFEQEFLDFGRPSIIIDETVERINFVAYSILGGLPVLKYSYLTAP